VFLVELTPFILIRGVIRLVEVLVMIEAIGQTHSRVKWPKPKPVFFTVQISPPVVIERFVFYPREARKHKNKKCHEALRTRREKFFVEAESVLARNRVECAESVLTRTERERTENAPELFTLVHSPS